MVTEAQLKIWHERQRLRSALCTAYRCFTHETEMGNLDSIRLTGLEAHDPGPSSDDDLIEQLGVNRRSMVCLHPLGSNGEVHSAKNGPFVLLKIKAADLPNEVTLDWSFPGSWSLVSVLEESATYGSTDAIFLEVVQRRGSVSALGCIAPNHIYVLCNGATAGLPEQWRALTDATEKEIVVYSSSGQPPSVPDCPAD